MDFPATYPPQPLVDAGILAAIGSTPLVRLDRCLALPEVALYAKLECANPGGSAKDRPARRMIEAALQEGAIDADSTVIESSSGNMGIGLAQVCRYYGLRLICVVDPRAQPQNIAIMKALGAEVDMVAEPVEGDFLRARLARVRWLLQHIPKSFWPNQYANQNNPQSHQQGTVREIDEALHGEVDYLFVATSSTGTARGCRDYFQRLGRHTKVVVVDALGSVLFGGLPGSRKIPGLGAGREPRLAYGQKFDGIVRVSDLDCVVECRRLAEREAMLIGGSAGGVMSAVRSMQDRLRGKTAVAIFHDSGTRYLDTIFSDDWVESVLHCPPNELERLIRNAGISQPEPVVA